ncbi:MAG: MGMT family protein [Cryomorphaceae bacterium]|nr:MGMT family protein [Cryomorphaceae bacterium]
MTANKDFYERVYAMVRKIPRGKVTTYGAIANALGSKQAARTVGYALNASITKGIDLPAHRVVNRKGLLTGKNHFLGATLMADLLRDEGITVENDQIKNFEEVLWIPEFERDFELNA